MAASHLRPLLCALVLTLRGHGFGRFLHKSPWKALPNGHSKCTSRKRAGPGFVVPLSRHWCRSLPRVRGNPSSFDVPEQSTDQSLEPFHQRWASLVADTTGLRTDGRCRRLLFGVSVGRLFLSYSSHDGQQFFRRCRLNWLLSLFPRCRGRVDEAS